MKQTERAYPVESEAEFRAVVAALVEDRASFVVVMEGDRWVETSLLRPGEELTLNQGQVATVVSWSGVHDKVETVKDDR